VELAQTPLGPSRLVATLQIEVAERLMAAAGDKDYGVLTLLVQLAYEPRGWFKIPAGSFFPSPDVDSACVCLVRRAHPLLPEALRRPFVSIVKRAFSQRRKMMRKLLKNDWPAEAVDGALAALAPEVSPETRAERVSLENFVRLTRFLATGSTDE
jgi:16S rRNA (adenine1518-N6/adenine1519-N6)-dimethyltransferase